MGATGSGRKCKPGEISRRAELKINADAKARARATALVRAQTGTSFNLETPNLNE